MEKLTLEPRFPNVLLCKKEVGLFGLEKMIFFNEITSNKNVINMYSNTIS